MRLIAPDSVQGAGLAILARQLGGHRVEALSDGFDYGDTLSEGFVRAARRLGLQVVGPHGWGDGDYRALAARVAAAHPDAVLVAGYQGPSAAHLLQAPHLKLISDAVRWACRVRCFLREPLNRLFVIWYRMVLPHCGLPVASFRW